MNYILAFLHFLFALFISLYGIFTKKNNFDIYYIYGIILLVISWTFFNGECSITYYAKKLKNSNYIAGENNINLDDIFSSFHSFKKIAKETIFVSNFLLVISLYIVLYRNNYPWYIENVIPLLTFIYLMACRFIKQTYKNRIFLEFQLLVKIYFILIILKMFFL